MGIFKTFKACECSTTGSSSTSCDKSGQCTCKPSIVGTKCTDCTTGFYGFPNCKCKNSTISIIPFLEKYLLGTSKTFSACKCSTSGSSSTACNTNGQCTCKPNVVGTKCTECKSTFYGFPNCQGIN